MIYSLKIYGSPQDFNDSYGLFANHDWIVDKFMSDPHGQILVLWSKRAPR